jgi:membrane protease YdiL (CAAX protease family)
MKPYLKAICFLVVVTLLDFLFRKGFIGGVFPIIVSQRLTALLFFTLFALGAWFTSQWFCRTDNIGLKDLGISFDSKNRYDFFIGLIVGLVIWIIVSLVQSFTAGFSWELKPEISWYNMLYGLLFIFIADLGTELYTRGYPLVRFRDSFGAIAAIIIMTLFVALKSFSFNADGELLFYIISIPALHTIFFSIIYFKTKRLGAAVGVHTGANFATISIFDLRPEQANQTIPAGVFQPNVDLETLSLTALQLPWVLAAILFSVIVYFWWRKG